MSTKSSLFYANDDRGINIHIYFEHLDDKVYIDLEGDGVFLEEVECPASIVKALGGGHYLEPDAPLAEQ
ncbi:MAG TPA: hypothetical protein VK638_50325 [Edaphobacter sp.]|nr:hypothetical protein [Edaphobacter sp.]